MRVRPASVGLILALGTLGSTPDRGNVLVVVKEGTTRTVPIQHDRGFPAAQAVALVKALGYAWIDDSIYMDGEAVRFSVGSPFFTVGQDVHQLPNPVYRQGGHLMIPVSWALDWLPRARSRRWRYLDGRLVALPATTLRPPKRDTWLVVIDPGHGGKDPGTIGVRGTKEKDLTLAIAKKLAKRLEGEPGIDIALTRDRDTLIAFADRPRITQLDGGRTPDLFISIHGNSMPKKPSPHRGIETYFLAVAKTEEARQVALRENSAIEFETEAGLAELEPLQFILSDLQSTGNLRESSLLAGAVDEAVEETLASPNRGIKQAGFLVLVGASMPAVLVEVGYLSNRDEEKLLRSSSYQAKIADALADAVVNYLEGYGRRVWSSYGSGR